LLKGVKQFITSGSRAGAILTFARFRCVNSSEDLSPNAFVLEKDTPGFRVGTLEEKMGIRAVDVAELTFEDYPSSAKHLLGKEGKGEKVNDPVLTLYYVGY
jgi:alkylation response protein AidB-like acyl-CoA dehydrogenase